MENNKTNSEFNELKKVKQPIFVMTKVKKIKNWTKEEDAILMKVAQKFEYKNWNAIAEHLNGRSAIQCSARYKRIRPGIVKGAWTEEEDEYLLSLLNKFGKNWSLISKYMPSRSGKQIRDRFLNALDPDILKDKFTPEEDRRILSLYAQLGSSWSKIAKYLPRRTGDMIKNRFYSSLRKQIHNDDYREGLRKRKMQSNYVQEGESHFEQSEDLLPKLPYSQAHSQLLNNLNNNDNAPNMKTKKSKTKRRRVIAGIIKNKHISLPHASKKKPGFSHKKQKLPDNTHLTQKINPGLEQSKIINNNSMQDDLSILGNNLMNIHNFQMLNYMQNSMGLNYLTGNYCNPSLKGLVNQPNFYSNMMMLNQEQNLINLKMLDMQMAQLTNELLLNKAGGKNKDSLEGQLSVLKQLLAFTKMKLDFCSMRPSIPMTNCKAMENYTQSNSLLNLAPQMPFSQINQINQVNIPNFNLNVNVNNLGELGNITTPIGNPSIVNMIRDNTQY